MLLKEGYTIQIVGFILYTVYQSTLILLCFTLFHFTDTAILQIKSLQEPSIKHVNLFISNAADLQRCISFQVIQLHISTCDYFSEFFSFRSLQDTEYGSLNHTNMIINSIFPGSLAHFTCLCHISMALILGIHFKLFSLLLLYLLRWLVISDLWCHYYNCCGAVWIVPM